MTWLQSAIAFWRVEKTSIIGAVTVVMGMVALTSAPGEGHVNWPHWLILMAYWTVGPGALLFAAWVKTRNVTGGTITPQGNPTPPVQSVESATVGAPPVPVQPVVSAAAQTSEKKKNPWQ